MHGNNRIYLDSLRQLWDRFPCIAILGARQAGKTTLLKQFLPSASFFDLEKESDWQRIDRDPEFFLEDNRAPLILDEAQLSPKLFSALRVKIDQNRNLKGQYLISGSSSPELLKNISESLAGRIAIIELGTFHFAEAYNQEPSQLYNYIAAKDYTNLMSLTSNATREQLYELCWRGGYPEPFLKRNDVLFGKLWMENYFNTYINRDIRRLFPTLQIETYQRFIKMLAFSSGDCLKFSNFAEALDVSEPTIKSYFHIAEGTFLWRMIPSYQRNLRKRLIKMPKGHLRDTGLINYLLNIQSVEEMKNHPSFGNIWEVFIIEQLIKSLKANLSRFDYAYYRTSNHAKVDLILEGDFGLIPIEIKSGINLKSNHLRNLETFIEDYNCPIGLLINNADQIVNLSPKVVQIPAGFL